MIFRKETLEIINLLAIWKNSVVFLLYRMPFENNHHQLSKRKKCNVGMNSNTCDIIFKSK